MGSNSFVDDGEAHADLSPSEVPEFDSGDVMAKLESTRLIPGRGHHDDDSHAASYPYTRKTASSTIISTCPIKSMSSIKGTRKPSPRNYDRNTSSRRRATSDDEIFLPCEKPFFLLLDYI